eukprot:scaffold303467_cov71-Attheya_sp.AAC.1
MARHRQATVPSSGQAIIHFGRNPFRGCNQTNYSSSVQALEDAEFEWPPIVHDELTDFYRNDRRGSPLALSISSCLRNLDLSSCVSCSLHNK